MKLVKYLGVLALSTVAFTGCGSIKNMVVPAMDTTVKITSPKLGTVTEEQSNHWAHADLATDTIPGMSLDKAYKFLEGKTGEIVIVGVIDSGIDIEHEDLKDVLWTNTNEIAGNGIDDDKNGYVDDIHGWNFLGGDGVDAPEQLEITRIVAKLNPRFQGKTDADIKEEDKADFKKYEEYVKAYEASGSRIFQQMDRLVQIKNHVAAVKTFLGKDDFSAEEVQNAKSDDEELQAKMNDVAMLYSRGLTEAEITEAIEDTEKRLINYDFDFDGRAIVGDNPEDITDVVYGNGNVIGSKDIESHGTHVSGIILGSRNNGVGMNGVATNAVLMSVRAVPDGDERDKDVALAIRYAVDNGAKVINMSFGKSFSVNKEWVFEAIKYAAEKDVLLVHAAGNDGKNIDTANNWPNDSKDKEVEFADNMLTVGAMSLNYDKNLPATFSNYGKKNVDVFAPGVQIYSTVPKDEYEKYNGTSMASPEVAGIATLVRSYYPQLSASQVKHIIMNSGVKIDFKVIKPGEKEEMVPFSDLSVSGSVVNAYNALILADKMVNKK
ncbi:MAG: S8 family peptidase [Lutibacter sp.]|nr:S8 family peptidase [Lutibacter sp.]MBP9600223.1 S8 family peptidase [Lutibacter sp.]